MTEAAAPQEVVEPVMVAPTTLDGRDFPLETFKEAARELRRPFTAEAVKWKVQSGKLVVPYIDMPLVVERLNLVVPHLWQEGDVTRPELPAFEAMAGGHGLLCRLSIDGIPRADVGSGYKGKGLYSDAFKRAAVKFGVGVSLRALPKLRLSVEDGQLRDTGKKTEKGAPIFELTDKGTRGLVGGYRVWLENTGLRMFGPALDHGDVEGATGDVEAEAEATGSQAETPAEPQPLDTPAAKALIEKAETLRKTIPAKDLPKAQFDRQLAAASTDMAELEKFIGHLEGLQP